MNSITPNELKEALEKNKDAVLIDVRDPFEHDSRRIPEAENIPADEIEAAVERLKSIGTVYVHCVTGGRSSRVCGLLNAKGVNVVNVEGGIAAWEKAGFAVEGTGRRVIPVIRQVMIVAGTLIVFGVLAGMLLRETWLYLPLFVGAGLLFAGATGHCGMTKILAYMPWNK